MREADKITRKNKKTTMIVFGIQTI